MVKEHTYTISIQLGGELHQLKATDEGVKGEPDFLAGFPVSYEELDSIIWHGIRDGVTEYDGRTQNGIYYHIECFNDSTDPCQLGNIFS